MIGFCRFPWGKESIFHRVRDLPFDDSGLNARERPVICTDHLTSSMLTTTSAPFLQHRRHLMQTTPPPSNPSGSNYRETYAYLCGLLPTLVGASPDLQAAYEKDAMDQVVALC